MSTIAGWYYLHVNGDLIYKRDSPGQDADIRESDFAVGLWAWDNERPTAWRILVEALCAGAHPYRIANLLALWNCNDDDALNYANYAGFNLGEDGDMKTASRKDFDNLQESPMGFGKTYLEAMADLCKQLGFKPGKMWTPSFEDLVKVKPLTESPPVV